MSLTAGAHLGPYQILAAIGAGGMGEVYRARDTKLDREVALKVLPQAFTRDRDRVMRFEREAKTLASLNHPHIAQIDGFDGHALAMELVAGDDLAQVIVAGHLRTSGGIAFASPMIFVSSPATSARRSPISRPRPEVHYLPRRSGQRAV
jgi:serine/threonine protein kinase